MSIFKPFGIATKNGEATANIRPEDFGRDGYRGVSIWNTHRKDKMAVIMESTGEPHIYQVVHGFSCICFGEYAEAEAYCRQRSFTPAVERRP